MLPWIFDVDGVLCDTRKAVELSYKEAGVEFPEHAWGLSKQEWFIDEEAHTKKNDYYPSFLKKYGMRSPICLFVRDLLNIPDARVGALSSASESAVASVLDFVGLSDLPVLGAGCTANDKYDILLDYAPCGFYVDDNKINIPPGWFLLRANEWMR